MNGQRFFSVLTANTMDDTTPSNNEVGSEPLPTPTRRRMHGPDYSPGELAEKEAWLKRLALEWPDLTPFHHELVYDYCAKTPQEEIDQIIESGEWEKAPSRFSPEATAKIIADYNKQTVDDDAHREQ